MRRDTERVPILFAYPVIHTDRPDRQEDNLFVHAHNVRARYDAEQSV